MDQKRILLHRISYCKEISYPLLRAGYLSIGWAGYVNEKTQEDLTSGNLKDFETFVNANTNASSRYSLLRFVHLKKGDWVVVPHPYSFSVYEVLSNPITIWQLLLPEQIKDANNNPLSKDSRGFLLWKNKKGKEETSSNGNKKVFANFIFLPIDIFSINWMLVNFFFDNLTVF